ncbi:protein NRT1/ PTR FAMILY 7.3-like [Typha angustifolia]|uniref:protein NRT1/ PTR FAMILY 7.3-like n=1 Tax=Typha angustifolia TaxID=59011 RepID=UPI003C2EC9FB
MEKDQGRIEVGEMKAGRASSITNGYDCRDEEECCSYTMDGSVDYRGRPAAKAKTGGWMTGSILLVNQGLATLAFFGVGVNLVLFLTRVVRQSNADAANTVSKWTGTVYLFSLVGAFLSDCYWGRYKTCAIFQLIFVFGLVLLSLATRFFLINSSGCGDRNTPCRPHSDMELGIFYISIYLIALGNGGYQPNVATLGADQFDEDDPKEAHSKVSFFSYFYLALNLGSLFSNTFLDYFEDEGLWAIAFWASAGSAILGLTLFLAGARRYRRFQPTGNPLSRACQVIVAAARKRRVQMTPGGDDLYEEDGKEVVMANGSRKMLHTVGLKFLDRAALIEHGVDSVPPSNPWRLCTITQVEELKCVLRLLPIWLTTILYSVVFAQMTSLFVEQGAAMNTSLSSFRIPPASMSSFDILSVAAFLFLYRRLIAPVIPLTQLQRMGLGLAIAVAAMLAAGAVEHFRLRDNSINILWQIPQYVLIGASEVFMYVGQLEFFNKEVPSGLKSFGSALCMASISMGNYVSSVLVTMVMEVTSAGGRPGWIPDDLDEGHMDRFFFLLAVLTSVDLVAFVVCARWYEGSKVEESFSA